MVLQMFDNIFFWFQLSLQYLYMRTFCSRIIKSINHENIIRCMDAWLEMHYDPRAPDKCEQEPLKFYVLMDFCYQSLNEWIIEVRKKPELKDMVLILKHTLAGLRFLHSKQILHLDINVSLTTLFTALSSKFKQNLKMCISVP